MVIFPAKCNVLAGHVIKSCRSIPRFVGIAGILGEIRCPRSCGSAIDRWQEHQITPRIIDLAATKRHAVLVFCKPEAVVDHETEKALLGPNNPLPADDLHRVTGATYSASMLASSVTGKRKCGLADELLWIVVVLDLDAVI